VSVDEAALRKLMEDLGGQREIMEELFQTFFAEVPRTLGAMQQAARTGDARELNRAAHSLKSTSGTFGARQMSALCRALEAATNHHAMPADAVEQASRIEREWQQVRAALEAWRRRL
jgi:HPt (histidine-containing phosphotransfer) domain-containing protein